jgi:predicted extracellular nuclease
VNLRLPAIALTALIAAAIAAPSALAAPSTTVVISQVAFRGPAGGNDELVQIRNVSATAQAIGGWQIFGTNSTGSAVSGRATVPTGVSLPAGKSFLFTNVQPAGTSGGSYSGTVPGDVEYSTGIADTGGVQLRTAAGTVVDAVGSTGLSGAGLPFREGAGLNFPTANGGDAFLRKSGGTQDTDSNTADFSGPQAAAPEACGSACAVADPCAGDASGIVRINAIQTLGANSACDGRTVKIRGVVTGIDDLYGSSYDAIYKADSGLWVQEATHDPGATTSEGIFIAGVRRNPADPAGVIGDNITISGKIVTQFGLVELVPDGVGSVSSPAANEVDLTSVATINSTGNPLPAPIAIDPAQAASQDAVTRPYYRSLQGMRVRLAEGIATGGGTTKFRDVYLEPGTVAQRLFRKNVATAETTPWLDSPQELGIAADGGAGDPVDPRQPWFSSTQVDMDLFDVARNVVGPLTYTFSFYEVMPQLPVAGRNDGEQPTVQRGAIDAAYPPHAPAQPPNTFRLASFNVENYFPPGEVNDGHTITQAEYDARTDQIVKAVHSFLGDPDVIAVQEVAVFPDGSNALTGLAHALGNYTPYNAVNNDPRGIAPGFLVKNGVTASNPRLIGADALYNDWNEGTCDLAGGKLYDRAPFALDVRKGDLAITTISNHWGAQSHQEPCRVAEAEYLRRQVATMEGQGANVLVAGDLNDFETSDALARLTQGGTLLNQWSKAPAGDAYSYKFDGHLQTLDHILLSPSIASREADMRYIHLDNDYYERRPTDGTGVSDHDPPLITLTLAGTSSSGDVSGTVPATLALTLGAPAALGTFVPGIGTDYTATMTASVTSTAADAQLTVQDPSANATGHLVNGTFSLAQPLQVRADGAFAPLHADSSPLALHSYAGPVTTDPLTLGFKQTIGATEPLRTGSYAKTLVFTLSTTSP